MLTSLGYKIKKIDVCVNKIANELTVKPSGDFMNNDMDSEFCLCMETTKYIYVPKYYGIMTFGVPIYNIKSPKDVNYVFNGTLLDIQKDPVSEYLNAARDPQKMGGILQLPPGFGKTVMALYISSVLKTKTLVIVHKEFLMNQWIERIHQYIPGASVGILKQSKAELDNDIVVASLQSVCMRDYPQDVFAEFGLVIIDECHHVGARVFSKALNKINLKYTLGLSATVNRKDGLSKVFKWYIGDIVYRVKKKDNSRCIVQLYKFNNTSIEYRREFSLYNGKINMPRMMSNICSFTERTKFIADIIASTLRKTPSRNCIVLSERRQHLLDISSLLPNDIDFGFYIGGMKNDDLELSKTKNVILGTYNMVSEGFDLPKLDTLILATSKSDVEQSVGRIQRKQTLCDTDNVPTVIDIIDPFSVFGRQSEKRKSFYKKRKYEIIN
jgi:superfamily II DNA or RNA helicase